VKTFFIILIVWGVASGTAEIRVKDLERRIVDLEISQSKIGQLEQRIDVMADYMRNPSWKSAH
jgi:hypothetical protein